LLRSSDAPLNQATFAMLDENMKILRFIPTPEQDKAKAAVGYDYAAMDFDYLGTRVARKVGEECESRRLRR
jgi:hypothetical protein